jgi:hypothetical protein
VLTIELDVVGSAAAVEDLNIDLALRQRGHIKPHNSEYSLDNLSPYNSRLREARAHDEDVDAQVVRAEGVLNVTYKVTGGVISAWACDV